MTVPDFWATSVFDLAAEVRSGRVDPVEVTDAALARIEARNDDVNAFVATDEARAWVEARRVANRLSDGEDLPLAGVPIGVKDLEDAAGYATTMGSRTRTDAARATIDSTLVARLKAAGCVVVGKTNTSEFGYTGDTFNDVFGPTRNPWALERSPGGSSGGSAAAIASGMVPLATGSDGGGSLRIPSALCGLAGFKTGIGRVPGGPGRISWPTLSVKGPMARRSVDLTRVLDLVTGPDATDQRSLPDPAEPWFDPDVTADDARVDSLVPVARRWTGRRRHPHRFDQGHPHRRSSRGGGRGDRPRSRSRPDRCIPRAVRGRQPRRGRTPARYRWLGTHRTRAPRHSRPGRRCRHPARPRRSRLHRPGDLPTHGPSARSDHASRVPGHCRTRAPSAGLGTINGEPTAHWIRFTYPFNLSRSPAGTVPIGRDPNGVPLGLQIVGPLLGEKLVLDAMAAFEGILGPLAELPALH